MMRMKATTATRSEHGKPTITFSKHCNSEMRQYSSLELRRSAMIPIHDLFEAHLTVANLQRSMSFFGDALGLELA